MKALECLEGATPLDREEAEGLRLTHITNREELNLFEAENIHAGMMWAWRSRRKEMLDEGFIKLLHKKMFGDVWTWAGEFRQSNKIRPMIVGNNTFRHCRWQTGAIMHSCYALSVRRA